MPAITLEVSDTIAASLAELAQRCTEADREEGSATSHGALTVPKLLAMLAEDAAMAVSRPRSWEGAGLLRVLMSHGYEV